MRTSTKSRVVEGGRAPYEVKVGPVRLDTKWFEVWVRVIHAYRFDFDWEVAGVVTGRSVEEVEAGTPAVIDAVHDYIASFTDHELRLKSEKKIEISGDWVYTAEEDPIWFHRNELVLGGARRSPPAV